MAEPLSARTSPNGARHRLTLLALPPFAAPVAHEIQEVGALRAVARERWRRLGPVAESADRDA